MKGKNKTRLLVQFSILLAVEAIFCFTPLGSLPALGPIVATLAHVPVIITAILMGPWVGSLMGLFTGLFSLIIWTFLPPMPLVAFVFSPAHSFLDISGNIGSIFISIVPRVLIGMVTGLVYQALQKKKSPNWLQFGFSGFLGSLINTIGVLGSIWLFFGEAYAEALGGAIGIIVGFTVLTNGIPEAIVGAMAAYFVGRPLQKALTLYTKHH